MATAKTEKYKPKVHTIVRGRCGECGGELTPFTRVCLACHHAELEAAGFDWTQISGLRSDMGGATGFNRGRLA